MDSLEPSDPALCSNDTHVIASLLVPGYAEDMLRSALFRTRFAMFALILAFLTSGISFGIAHSIHRTAATTYRERSSLYAVALASASTSWLPSGDPGDTTEQQLRFPLLSLGVVYVRVSSDEGLVMDIRRSEFSQARLPTLNRVSFPTTTIAATIFRFENHWAVDVVVPLSIFNLADSAEEAGGLGMIQLGIDATELARANQRTTTITAFSSLAIWLFVSVSLFCLLRRQDSRAEGRPEHCSIAADAARRIVAGDLALFLDELRFEVGTVTIDLTPKQAALLEMLISHPGRAFSDESILKRVWQTSSYASSSDVKQQIYLIRKKLRGAGLPALRILVTVSGVGYKLAVSQNDAVVDAPSTDKSRS